MIQMSILRLTNARLAWNALAFLLLCSVQSASIRGVAAEKAVLESFAIECQIGEDGKIIRNTEVLITWNVLSTNGDKVVILSKFRFLEGVGWSLSIQHQGNSAERLTRTSGLLDQIAFIGAVSKSLEIFVRNFPDENVSSVSFALNIDHESWAAYFEKLQTGIRLLGGKVRMDSEEVKTLESRIISDLPIGEVVIKVIKEWGFTPTSEKLSPRYEFVPFVESELTWADISVLPDLGLRAPQTVGVSIQSDEK